VNRKEKLHVKDEQSFDLGKYRRRGFVIVVLSWRSQALHEDERNVKGAISSGEDLSDAVGLRG
jgi:hypothetical protein